MPEIEPDLLAELDALDESLTVGGPMIVESENDFQAGPGTMSLEAVIVFDDGSLQIDFARFEAVLDGEPILMTPKELGRLRMLVETYGKPVSSDKLAELVPAAGRTPKVRMLSVVHVKKEMKWFAPIVPAQDGLPIPLAEQVRGTCASPHFETRGIGGGLSPKCAGWQPVPSTGIVLAANSSQHELAATDQLEAHQDLVFRRADCTVSGRTSV